MHLQRILCDDYLPSNVENLENLFHFEIVWTLLDETQKVTNASAERCRTLFKTRRQFWKNAEF